MEELLQNIFSKMQEASFGKTIRKRRVELGLPLREVAAAADFDPSLLSKVERNKMTAPAKIIPALARSLQLNYEELQIKYLSDYLYQELKYVDYSVEAISVVSERLVAYQKPDTKAASRKKLLEKLRVYFQNQPIEKVWIFGSFAREEENSESDLDLLVRFSQPHAIDLFQYVGIQQDLEDLVGRKVDLVEEGQEKESIQAVVAKERKLIYERKTNG